MIQKPKLFMIYHIIKEGLGRGRHKVARPVKNREELLALRNSEENLSHLAKARQGDDAAKAKLVQLAYNLGHVEGRLAGCKSIGSHFFHDVDCYPSEEAGAEREESRAKASEQIKELILSKKDEIGLEMLERSASGGWHLVCRRVKGTTILENQVRVSCILHLEMDTSTKDLQRVSFTTSGKPDDLVYLDDSIFGEPMSAEECEDEYTRLKIRERRGLEQVPAGAKKANKHYRPWEEHEESRRKSQGLRVVDGKSEMESASPTPSAEESPAGNSQPNTLSPTPTPAEADRSRFIVRGVMKEKGLVESDFTDEGGRHTSVKILLSGCAQLLSKDEVNAVLRELMPEHWNDQNIQQLVDDFYQNYTNPSQRLLKYQEQLFTQSRRLYGGDKPNGKAERMVNGEALPSAESTPPMPAKLPKLIQLLTSRTPDSYKAAVAHAVFRRWLRICAA